MPIQPKGKIVRSNTPKEGYANAGHPLIEIAAWCPDENAELPPEQVHFIVHWPVEFKDMPPMVIRFNGPDSLGFFIEELTKYRKEVWPDSKDPNEVSTPEEIRKAIRKMYSRLDYKEFCEYMGFNPQYDEEYWNAFQKLAQALGRFDTANWQKICEFGGE